MPWTVLDHTADVGIEVHAATLDALFADAASALCDVITDVERIEARVEAACELTAEAPDLLLVTWLEELLFRFDSEGVLYPCGEVRVAGAEGAWTLAARLRGEAYDPRRHPLKVQVKAVTYHGLEVARDEQGWRARVIFDL
jgi:protein archease